VNGSRPTGSVGSCTERPMLSFTSRRVMSARCRGRQAAIARDGRVW
jgi:hypothetical protein